MLNIHPVVVQVVEGMRDVLAQVERHDKDLARQGRRAVLSILLNVKEAMGSEKGNRKSRWFNALGSARETEGLLDGARHALRHVDRSAAGRTARSRDRGAGLARTTRVTRSGAARHDAGRPDDLSRELEEHRDDVIQIVVEKSVDDDPVLRDREMETRPRLARRPERVEIARLLMALLAVRALGRVQQDARRGTIELIGEIPIACLQLRDDRSDARQSTNDDGLDAE
jgi:four helix bundle protein